MNEYLGWWIKYDRNAPVTGRWRATRQGVGMCHNTREGLESMIRAKVAERRSKGYGG